MQQSNDWVTIKFLITDNKVHKFSVHGYLPMYIKPLLQADGAVIRQGFDSVSLKKTYYNITRNPQHSWICSIICGNSKNTMQSNLQLVTASDYIFLLEISELGFQDFVNMAWVVLQSATSWRVCLEIWNHMRRNNV
jgi:hypothetical protein